MPKKNYSTNDNYITNKLLTVFTVTLIAVFCLMILNQRLAYPATFMAAMSAIRGFTILSGVLCVFGVVIMLVRRELARGATKKLLSGKSLAILGALVCLALLFIQYYFLDGIKVLFVVVPASAALYLIYHVQKVFFCHSVVCALSAGAMWCFRRVLAGQISLAPVFLAVSALVLVALVALGYQLKKNRGKMKLFGKDYALLPARTNYNLLFVTAALMLTAFAVAFICGATIAYYLVFGILGYLFLLAVYFTIRSM